MEITLALAAAGALLVALAAVLGPKLRVPAPLILVVAGILVGLPFGPTVALQPELVLVGVLPPLLFTASVSLPAMNLRREFGAVSGLSVLLVLITALVLGWILTLLIPGLDYGWGVALGAIISPTDAVATSIVKRTAVSSRVTAILEGESLLNDATALVLLRAAISAAGAASVSVPQVLGGFAYSVAVAVVMGVVAARLGQAVRRRVRDPAVGTLLSFVLPFVASLPAEALGASGLVAAVAAGITVGRRSARVSSPQQRLSDQQSWRTVALALEGAVFLLMGLQIRPIVSDAQRLGGGALGTAILIGAIAVAVTLVVRAAYVGPLLGLLHLQSRRGQDLRERLVALQEAQVGDAPMAALGSRRARTLRGQGQVDRFRRRVRVAMADIDYLAASPLGAREGAVVVWAGMRGAVTVAAAQTVPEVMVGGEDLRPLLVLIAFAAATISLVLQGGTLSALIALLKPSAGDPAALGAERDRLRVLMRRAVEAVAERDGESRLDLRVRQLTAQREALLDARDLGAFDAELLTAALETVDSAQITTELFDDPGR